MTLAWLEARPATAMLATLALATLFLTARLGSYPIELWDESRQAVNAVEIHLRGLSLVTTYGFAPDHWNTKPPLLIWLMQLPMAALGPTELAVRLPSALAAIGTVALVLWFTRKVSGSAATACLAAVLLVTSPAFFGEHAAATGDYDALLTLLVTGYALLAFLAFERDKPASAHMAAIGLIVTAAGLTKGIAGLVPGVGIVAFVILRGEWRRLFTPRWLLAAAIPLVLLAVYYVVREAAAPGYLAGVSTYELGGRFRQVNGHHDGPARYYLWLLFDPRRVFDPAFSGSFAIMLALPALVAGKGRSPAALIYALCVAGGILLVYSLAKSKLPWYVVPAIPFLSIALALSCQLVFERLAGARLRAVAVAAVAIAAAGLAANAVRIQDAHIRRMSQPGAASYGAMFAALDRAGVRRLRVIDGGVPNSENMTGYWPQLRFYTLVWRERGLRIDYGRNGPARMAAVSCDDRFVAGLRATPGRHILLPGCAALIPAPGPSGTRG